MNTKEEIYRTIFLYIAVSIALLFSVFSLTYKVYKNNIAGFPAVSYSQPQIDNNQNTWAVRSIDMEKATLKNPPYSRDQLKNRITLLKDTGINFVAISPYFDDDKVIKMWAQEIHGQGLHIWYRSTWRDWHGTLTPSDYIYRTGQFIINNKELFSEGDAFSFVTEPELTGVGLGEKFLNWNEFNKFLLDGFYTTNETFKKIGMEGKIHTNWILLNPDTVLEHLSPEFVQQTGLLTVVLLGDQNHTIGQKDDMSALTRQIGGQLESVHQKWDVPVLVGKFGYQINQKVDEETQSAAIDEILKLFKGRSYITGVNYYGGTDVFSELISLDKGGTLNTRASANTLRTYFQNSGN